MHEQVIAQALVREAQRQEGLRGRIKGITVQVGELAHVPAHEMREVLATLCPRWSVVVEQTPARVHCKECGLIGRPLILEKGHDHNVFSCSGCGMMMPSVLEGKDIILKEVELE